MGSSLNSKPVISDASTQLSIVMRQCTQLTHTHPPIHASTQHTHARIHTHNTCMHAFKHTTHTCEHVQNFVTPTSHTITFYGGMVYLYKSLKCTKCIECFLVVMNHTSSWITQSKTKVP